VKLYRVPPSPSIAFA